MSAPTPRILVVDDEVEHARTLVRLLQRDGLGAEAVHGVSDAMTALNRGSYDVVLSDLLMPGKDGLDLLRAVEHLQIDVDVIVMTAFGTVERAVEAMKTGAYDFLVKPVRRTTVLRAVRRALERRSLRQENAALRAALARQQGESARIVGVSDALRRVLDTARQAAQSDATVLLLGESGTGKELFAKEIHERSMRASGPFVALHCAALPDTIIESELFGHEAGSFTGASGRRAGRFEAAHEGTLFLDEVGELHPETQVKLLRVLQEGEVVRVGGNLPLRVDVRIVAATHRDLQAMVREGRFREDLFYRLHVIPIALPPLRERREDIPLLAASMLAASAARNRRNIEGCTEEALEALRGAQWPGNVRQLQNVLERAVVLDRDGRIGLDDLPDIAASSPPRSPESIRIPIGTPLAEVERRIILATLDHAEGDKSLAASLLGVGRRTVYRKLEEYAALEEGVKSSANEVGDDADDA